MSEEKVVYVKQRSNLVGIFAIVFAIIGIFFLAIVFVPLAIICSIVATFQSIKKSGSIVVAVIAWILTFIAFLTSPTLLAILGFGNALSKF